MQYPVIILFIAVISTNVMAQNYGLGNSDYSSFFRYRIPETGLRKISVNTNFDYSSSKTSYASLIQNDNNYSSHLNYSLSPRYFLLKESDNRYLAADLSLTGNYYRYYNKTQNSSTISYDIPEIKKFEEYSSSNNSSRFNLSLISNYNSYFANDLFYSFGFNSQVNIYDTYSNQMSTNNPALNKDNKYEGAKSQNYIFSFGIGWGRYRNISSVVSALRFQERLKHLNLVNSNLNERAIEDLAEQFNRQFYYLQAYDRPEKYFWQDIEKILVNNNIIPISSLNQYAASYLREVPGELKFLRNEGFITGINMQINYLNTYYSHNSVIFEELYTLGRLFLQYSHQMNLNSQIGFTLMLSGGPNLIKNPINRQMYSLSSQFGYDYELTDRIVTSIRNKFDLTFKNSSFQEKSMLNDLRFSINYFIEDNLALQASYQWAYSERKNELNWQATNINNENRINFGFTYYLDRGFLYY